MRAKEIGESLRLGANAMVSLIQLSPLMFDVVLPDGAYKGLTRD